MLLRTSFKSETASGWLSGLRLRLSHMGSRLGQVIPKTIIKWYKLPPPCICSFKGRAVCGTVYGDMLIKYLMGS